MAANVDVVVVVTDAGPDFNCAVWSATLPLCKSSPAGGR